MNDKYKSKAQNINDQINGQTRRNFLKTCIAAGSVTGLLNSCASHKSEKIIPQATEMQKQRRYTGESIVALIKCPSYDENIFELIKPYASQAKLPSFKNKRVVVKFNMIDYRAQNPIHTNPAMIGAAAELVNYLGAKEIIFAEGPGNMRDIQYLLDSTGIGNALKKHKMPFVDLNSDDLVKVDNPDNFSKIDHFYLPRTIVEADAVISVPKLKTHHIVGVTASMKNFFGTVPGRKYGWPKNILHWHGIDECIMDLNHLIKPVFSLVDAVISMEGDGPLNGPPKATGFIALGTDLAAVDATCIRAMSIDPNEILYVKLAGDVIGNIDSNKIKIIGADLKSITQKFDLPVCLLPGGLEAAEGAAGQQGS
jgi:uncharacterized protein (DUF362 family)